jgi:hypothetical protein
MGKEAPDIFLVAGTTGARMFLIFKKKKIFQ